MKNQNKEKLESLSEYYNKKLEDIGFYEREIKKFNIERGDTINANILSNIDKEKKQIKINLKRRLFDSIKNDNDVFSIDLENPTLKNPDLDIMIFHEIGHSILDNPIHIILLELRMPHIGQGRGREVLRAKRAMYELRADIIGNAIYPVSKDTMREHHKALEKIIHKENNVKDGNTFDCIKNGYPSYDLRIEIANKYKDLTVDTYRTILEELIKKERLTKINSKDIKKILKHFEKDIYIHDKKQENSECSHHL